MAFSYRPAVREKLPLLIGMAGGTGSGKTFSAMTVAEGMTPKGERFAVVDTENGRALHYADRFNFDHGILKAPFTAERYLEAVTVMAKEHAVVVIDSFTHEWAGRGGVLEQQEEEFKKMGYAEPKRLLSWQKPKAAHNKMVDALLQVDAQLIVCFRAKHKIEIQKDPESNRNIVGEKVGPNGYKGWFPVTQEDFPFELTVSMMFLAEQPGYPQPIKVEEQFQLIVPSNKPISADAGRLFAIWANGGDIKTGTLVPAQPPKQAPVVPQAQKPAAEPPRAARVAEAPVAAVEEDELVAVHDDPVLDVQGNPIDASDLPFDDEPVEMEDVIAQRSAARGAPAFVPPEGSWWADFQAGAKSAQPPVLAAQIRNVMQRPVTMKHTFDYICEKRTTWPELLATAGQAPT